MTPAAAVLRPRPADLGLVAEPVMLAISLPVALVLALTAGPPAAAGVLAVLWPLAVAGWAYAAVRRRNLRLERDDRRLVHVGVWGRRTEIPRTAIGAARIVSFGGPAGVPGLVVVVTAVDGAAVLALWEPRWDADRTARFLGGLVRFGGRVPDPTLAGVRAAFPGLRVPFPVAHPVLAALGGAVAFLAYSGAVVTAVVAAST